MENQCQCLRLSTPSIQDVIITFERRGKGTLDDLSRRVLQVHCPHGTFIAEHDPIDPLKAQTVSLLQTIEDMRGKPSELDREHPGVMVAIHARNLVLDELKQKFTQ